MSVGAAPVPAVPDQCYPTPHGWGAGRAAPTRGSGSSRALLCARRSFPNTAPLPTVSLVLSGLLSDGFKEFCAGERLVLLFFQRFVFFKNLELIIKKNPASCGPLLFPWKLVAFPLLACVRLRINVLSLWRKGLAALFYCTFHAAVTHSST